MSAVFDYFAWCNVPPTCPQIRLVQCCLMDKTFAVSLDLVCLALSIFHREYGSQIQLSPVNEYVHERRTDGLLFLHQWCMPFPCVQRPWAEQHRLFPTAKRQLVCLI